jgi:hypothetical protein
VNLRRNLCHVLLSLLLVLSQQMGFTHALSHASAAVAAGPAQAIDQAADDTDGVTKLGLDHSCAQCLAFAQIGSAADTRFYSFPLAIDGASTAIAFVAAAPDGQRTVCGFLSRAPPVLS